MPWQPGQHSFVWTNNGSDSYGSNCDNWDMGQSGPCRYPATGSDDAEIEESQYLHVDVNVTIDDLTFTGDTLLAIDVGSFNTRTITVDTVTILGATGGTTIDIRNGVRVISN